MTHKTGQQKRHTSILLSAVANLCLCYNEFILTSLPHLKSIHAPVSGDGRSDPVFLSKLRISRVSFFFFDQRDSFMCMWAAYVSPPFSNQSFDGLTLFYSNEGGTFTYLISIHRLYVQPKTEWEDYSRIPCRSTFSFQSWILKNSLQWCRGQITHLVCIIGVKGFKTKKKGNSMKETDVL